MEYRNAICDDSPADAEYVAPLVKMTLSAWEKKLDEPAVTLLFLPLIQNKSPRS